MTVFQIVKRVLDQEYEYLEGSSAERDKAVLNALELLGKKYRTVLDSGGPDLSDPTIRFAYIYRYSTAHANMAYEFIRSSEVLSKLFDQETLTISCVGGGPGSDLLGVLKYLFDKKKKPKIYFYLLDKEEAWGESWADVDQVVGRDLNSSTNFRPLDVCDREVWQKQRKFLQADLFTFIYFFSELYSQKDDAEEFFDYLFDGTKKGARFLFIDFRDSNLTDWFDGLCNENRIEIVESGDQLFQTDYDEEKRDLADYYKKFDNPKIKASISYRVCQKK
jgi:hypothetical protein